MSSDILHIKDSYYFEIPKVLAPARFESKADFPQRWDVWVRLDDQFQQWEFDRLYERIQAMNIGLPADKEHLRHQWEHWTHEKGNHGKPLGVYLEEHAEALFAGFRDWSRKEENLGKSWEDYLATAGTLADDFSWFAVKYRDPAWRRETWAPARREAADVDAFRADDAVQWSQEKLDFYNFHLSGKILIPQPFGELRNLYEAQEGFCISKFMIIQLVVGMLMFLAFSWVARRIATGAPPKGRLWNLLEVFLVFIRDQIATPAIGGAHHDDDHHDTQDHHEAAELHLDREDLAPPAPAAKPHAHAHHAHDEVPDDRRFTPVLWTVFFFVLGCNLFGIAPWAGAPTASFNVTLALAGVTLLSVVVGGMRKWGFLGFFLNLIPSMDLPLPIAIILKPGLFLIEIVGLMIKHAVLAIRLLANMVAGHLVILGIMGLAFGMHTALGFIGDDVPAWQWPVVAGIAVTGATLFNILELFVAFLQAYVFTFLSALFIGASVHKH
jgi:F-type H+-transporting ATPase subunit a